MKKIITSLFLLFLSQPIYANDKPIIYYDSTGKPFIGYIHNPVEKSNRNIGLSAKNFLVQVKADTLEIAGKQINAFWSYDFLDKEDCLRTNIAIGAPILAWKFLSMEPSLTYNYSNSDNKAEFQLLMPLRLGRIPVGNSKELRDYLKDYNFGSGTILEKLCGQFYLGQNVSSGKFLFGWRLSYVF